MYASCAAGGQCQAAVIIVPPTLRNNGYASRDAGVADHRREPDAGAAQAFDRRHHAEGVVHTRTSPDPGRLYGFAVPTKPWLLRQRISRKVRGRYRHSMSVITPDLFAIGYSPGSQALPLPFASRP